MKTNTSEMITKFDILYDFFPVLFLSLGGIDVLTYVVSASDS